MTSAVQYSGSIADLLLEPAIEGPPSPETIRAISNQMRWAASTEKNQSQQGPQGSQGGHGGHQSRQSHHTTSSGSSSLRSLTSAIERPSWDTTVDSTPSLSRKSSGRSIASAQPASRESVRIFGKTIFGKRGRLRRESSAQSSSNSSLHSAEIPYDKGAALLASPPLPPAAAATGAAGTAAFPTITASQQGSPTSGAGPREALIPSFFSRRRNTKSGSPTDDLEGRRKLQISGPYNFQHLAHTQREQFPSHVSPQAQPDTLRFPSFSSETLPIGEDVVLATVPRRFPMRPHAASVSSVYPPSRPLHHTRSQDQLRIPPPRPPRSPIQASSPSSSFCPPTPPPRLSSRASLRTVDMDAALRSPMERPRTSGGFRHPTPFSFSSPDLPRSPAMHAHSHSCSADMGAASVDARRFVLMATATATPNTAAPGLATSPATSPGAPAPARLDKPNWPLAGPGPTASTATTAATASGGTFGILPGVPEEEEHAYNPRNSGTRRPRLSVSSNASSSLRKSHSLPLLQLFPQSQSQPQTQAQTSGSGSGGSTAQRPPSAASDTLGGLDARAAAQQSLREGAAKAGDDSDAAHFSHGLPNESWEDDIDYCYEHEIEADCEYAWDRPSLDGSRDEIEIGDEDEDSLSGGRSRTPKTSDGPGLASPPPLLSPASQTSMTASSIDEAITPPATGSGNGNGSSLAMRRPPGLTIQTKIAAEDELRPMHKFLHARSSSRGSRASSFMESHGFNLSPSLFIPGSDKYERYFQHCGAAAPAAAGPAPGLAAPSKAPSVLVRGLPGSGFAIGADDDDLDFDHADAGVDVDDGVMPAYMGPTVMNMETSTLLIPTRSSASTTASAESVAFSVRSDRHISATFSATSTATDLTRLTMSTASIEDLVFSKKDMEATQI